MSLQKFRMPSLKDKLASKEAARLAQEQEVREIEKNQVIEEKLINEDVTSEKKVEKKVKKTSKKKHD